MTEHNDPTTWSDEREQARIEGEKRALSDAERAAIESRRGGGT